MYRQANLDKDVEGRLLTWLAGDYSLNPWRGEDDLPDVLASYKDIRESMRQTRNARGFYPKSAANSFGPMPNAGSQATSKGAGRAQRSESRALSIQEKRLRTRCRTCGQIGHWSRECRQARQRAPMSSAPSASSKTSFFWSSDQGGPKLAFCLKYGRPSGCRRVGPDLARRRKREGYSVCRGYNPGFPWHRGRGCSCQEGLWAELHYCASSFRLSPLGPSHAARCGAQASQARYCVVAGSRQDRQLVPVEKQNQLLNIISQQRLQLKTHAQLDMTTGNFLRPGNGDDELPRAARRLHGPGDADPDAARGGGVQEAQAWRPGSERTASPRRTRRRTGRSRGPGSKRRLMASALARHGSKAATTAHVGQTWSF